MRTQNHQQTESKLIDAIDLLAKIHYLATAASFLSHQDETELEAQVLLLEVIASLSSQASEVTA